MTLFSTLAESHASRTSVAALGSLLVMLASCGSGASDGTAPIVVQPDPPSPAPITPDAGPPNPANDAGVAAPRGVGTIVLFRNGLTDIAFTGPARGEIYTQTPTASPACVRKKYESTGYPQGAPVGAGTLTFTGASLPTQGQSVTRDPKYGEYFIDLPHDFYVGGERVQVTGTGADVPAFSLSAIAPPTVTFTKPLWKSGEMVLQRREDLQLSWTTSPSTAGVLRLRLEDRVTPAGVYEFVECIFDLAKATATIPSAVLTTLGAGKSILSFQPLGRGTTTAGDFDLALEIWNDVRVGTDTVGASQDVFWAL